MSLCKRHEGKIEQSVIWIFFFFTLPRGENKFAFFENHAFTLKAR